MRRTDSDLPRVTDLPLRVRHRDVGMTIATDILLGDQLIVSYMAGTRHVSTAEQVASDLLASVLRTQLRSAGAEQGITHISAQLIDGEHLDGFDEGFPHL